MRGLSVNHRLRHEVLIHDSWVNDLMMSLYHTSPFEHIALIALIAFTLARVLLARVTDDHHLSCRLK